MTDYPLAGLVTLFTLFVYIWMAMQVGKARTKHGIKAPAHSGPEDFNRVMRAYENTLEMMVLFFPALWLFAVTLSDFWAGIVGVFFPIGRIIYARGYYQAGDKRGFGFNIGFGATIVLLIGATIGLLHAAYAIYG